MKEAYAYDQIAGEDVRINNCRDTPHDFDVQRAVQGDTIADVDGHEYEDDRGGTLETAREHPRLVKADFDHDPSEGCQGTETYIVDQECELCGYDRCTATYHTMVGDEYLTCNRCGATADDRGSWSPPTLHEHRVDDLRRFAEMDESPVENIGVLGGSRGRYSYGMGGDPVFRYSDSGLIKIVKNGTIVFLRRKELEELTSLLEDTHEV